MISKLRAVSEDKKRLFSNFFSLSVLQGANYLLPLITLPYLVRVLGAEKFGLVAFAQAFVQYFVILIDYGFNLSATREISIHREDKQKVSEIFCSVLIIKFTLMVLSLFLLCLIVFSFQKFKNEWLIYFLAFGMAIGQVLFPVWFFQGMERMKYITVLNITARVIFTVSIFLFVRGMSDYIYVPLLSSLGYIVAGILGQWVAFRDFKIRPNLPSIKCLWSYLKDSAQFFLSRASVSVFTSSNAFFLGLFTNNTVVGYYSAAEKLYLAFQGLYQPLTSAVYPYMAKYRNISLFKKIFKLSVLLNTVLCILLFIFSGQLVVLLFGNDFQNSILVFKIFTAALLIIVPSILEGYPFLAALGYAHYANGSIIAGSLFHIAALIIVSELLFINAPMVAALVVITQTIILSLRTYGVKKHKLWACQEYFEGGVVKARMGLA